MAYFFKKVFTSSFESVGIAVTSDTRGLQFACSQLCWKEVGKWLVLFKNIHVSFFQRANDLYSFFSTWTDLNLNSGPFIQNSLRLRRITQMSILLTVWQYWAVYKKFWATYFLFLNGPSPASFYLFSSFQTKIRYNFTTNKCENCPSSIWCWDLNPRPMEHESTPITTRLGLSAKQHNFFPMYVAQIFGNVWAIFKEAIF